MGECANRAGLDIPVFQLGLENPVRKSLPVPVGGVNDPQMLMFGMLLTRFILLVQMRSASFVPIYCLYSHMSKKNLDGLVPATQGDGPHNQVV